MRNTSSLNGNKLKRDYKTQNKIKNKKGEMYYG